MTAPPLYTKLLTAFSPYIIYSIALIGNCSALLPISLMTAARSRRTPTPARAANSANG